MKMKNNSLLEAKSELLQVSIYVEIIKSIVIKHQGLSVFKIVTFSFLKKNEKVYLHNIYKGNDSKDLVLKCISLMTGKYQNFIESIKYITTAIDILVESNVIYIDDNLIYCDVAIEKVLDAKEEFIDKAIIESYLFSDRQFMKEVVHNV